jgi:hypothetical protein
MSFGFNKSAGDWVLVSWDANDYIEKVITETVETTVDGSLTRIRKGYLTQTYISTLVRKREGATLTGGQANSDVGNESKVITGSIVGPSNNKMDFGAYGGTASSPQYRCIRDSVRVLDVKTGTAVNEQVWEYKSRPVRIADSDFTESEPLEE